VGREEVLSESGGAWAASKLIYELVYKCGKKIKGLIIIKTGGSHASGLAAGVEQRQSSE
jgi:hypothetical protein